MKNKTLQENAEKLDIEESREKRLGRIKAKRRDRGGIFQPREDNPLLDILMSRDISGRSPTKPRPRSQRPSVERDNRGSGPNAKSSMKRNGVPRRASAASNVSSNVAGKQRRMSQAPPSNTGYSDDEAATRGKVKSLSISRKSSQRSATSKGKSPAFPSKRPREADSEDDTDDADLPSPHKRPKKSVTSKSSASASTLKAPKSTRRPPSRSTALSQTKLKVPSGVSYDAEDEENPEEEILRPVEKELEKRKTHAESKGKSSASATESRSTSSSKSKRAPNAQNTKSSTNRKATKTAKAKQSSKHVTSEEQLAAALNTGFDNARRHVKKKLEPESEPESEEETSYRTRFPIPRLDTVIEEDEEDEVPLDNDEPTRPGQNISLKSSTRRPNGTKDSGKRKGKQKTSEDAAGTVTTTGKAKTKKKTGKASTRNVDDDNVVSQKPSSTARRKPKESAASSKRKSKPKSVPQSKPKSKPPSLAMRRSKFANLPTTMLSSPIRVTGDDDDEINFLS